MVQLFDAEPNCVLAIYAHPDDAAVSCGGALSYWSRAGAQVHLLTCTRGEKGSSDPEADLVELAQLRLAETAESASHLGAVGNHQLDHGDGEIEDTISFREEIVGWIRDLQPDIVLCPDPTAVFFGEDYYNHRDHRILGYAVLDAVSPAASSPHYFPTAGPAHFVSDVLMSGTLEPSVWVDITKSIDQKVKAVLSHRTQFADGGVWAREAVVGRSSEEGKKAGVEYAEGFRRLRVS